MAMSSVPGLIPDPLSLGPTTLTAQRTKVPTLTPGRCEESREALKEELCVL